MRKALVYGPFDLRIVDLPERTPAPGEVKADVVVALIGHHSVRLYEGHLPRDVPSRKHPVTLCYTAVARVSEVGPDVGSLRPGDLVYPNFYRACGRCDPCRADRPVACRAMPNGAVNMMVGEQYESGLQDYIVFPEWRLRPVPAGASVESIATTGSMSVGMQAVTAVDPQPWETVAVIGAGLLGLGCIQLCRLNGARVVAADLLPEHLERAKRFGAEAVVDARGNGAAERLVKACGSEPDVVIEAAGTPEASAIAIQAAARGARIALLGATPYPISQLQLMVKGLSVFGIGGGVRVQETINLLASGKLDITSAITHRFPFSQLRDALELKRADPRAQLVAVYIDEGAIPQTS